jgi:hypothetical protein
MVERFCGYIPFVMGYPFSWVRPGSILNGPQLFVLVFLFWGVLLYLLVYVLRRLRGKVI